MTPLVVPFPAVVPGGFESAPADTESFELPTAKAKAKKKKGKKAATPAASATQRAVPADAQSESSATAPESSTPVPRPKRKSPPVLDNDGPWTRVESRKKPARAQEATTSTSLSVEQVTSDTGITTSVTGTSEPTEDEQEAEGASEREPENRRTLAERLLPKPRKTKVEEYVADDRARDVALTLTLFKQHVGNSRRAANRASDASRTASRRAARSRVLVGRL